MITCSHQAHSATRPFEFEYPTSLAKSTPIVNFKHNKTPVKGVLLFYYLSHKVLSSERECF